MQRVPAIQRDRGRPGRDLVKESLLRPGPVSPRRTVSYVSEGGVVERSDDHRRATRVTGAYKVKRGQVISRLACPRPWRKLNSISGGGQTRTGRSHCDLTYYASSRISRTSSGRMKLSPSSQTDTDLVLTLDCSEPREITTTCEPTERGQTHYIYCPIITGMDP